MLSRDAASRIWRELQPKTFSDVIGRSSAVRALSGRVQSRDHAVPIILHGPSDVGKLALARLYAKAVRCEDPIKDGSPCHRCFACEQFGRAFGYFEVKDLAIGADSEEDSADRSLPYLRHRMSGLYRRLREENFDREVVLILGKADKLPSEVFDIILKTVEDVQERNHENIHHCPVIIIFLAESLSDMSRAGVSRCFAYPVCRLASAEARQIIADISKHSGFALPEPALNILVRSSEGLVGRLKANWSKVAGSGDISVSSVKKVLSLDWVEEVAYFWDAIMSDTGVPATLFRPLEGVEIREQVRRNRIFLAQVASCLNSSVDGLAVVADPAFMHSGCDPSHKITISFKKRAFALGVQPSTLVNKIASVWLSADIMDVHSFFEATRTSYYVVRGVQGYANSDLTARGGLM